MAKNNNLTDFLTDVADAIREKEGSSAPINPQDFSAKIRAIQGGGESGGGGASASAGAVNFRDYDGTILHSFSKDEFLALTEMPELPTQKGLTCQGWNYNIDDAKAYIQEYGVLEVGATYITDDGKTRLYITIAAEGRMNVPLYFSQTVANGVTIDWGDGSVLQTLNGTGNKNTSHTYTDAGEYTITLNPSSGCTLGLGHKSSSYCVMGGTGNNGRVYCNMLQAIEIGENVTSIGTYAFHSCCSLASIVIPQGVTSIGTYAFNNCYALASVVIPQSVTSIGSNAFYSCYSLASVVIPQSVTSISASAFYTCYSLASIVIPQGVTSISESAFSSCHALVSIVIPQSVKSIDKSAFNNCYALASVVIPQGVTSIGTYAFYNCYSLASVVIPQSVTSIGSNAFYSCRSLASVVIPQSVTSISASAFYTCYSLASVVIPQSVKSIDKSAFSNCYALASVVIPQGVTSIGNSAFSSCYGMAYYDFTQCASVPTLGTSVFSNISSDCKIIVPDALYDEWIVSTNWSSSNVAKYIIKASEFNG